MCLAILGHPIHFLNWEDLLSWLARDQWKSGAEKEAIYLVINTAVYESWKNSKCQNFSSLCSMMLQAGYSNNSSSSMNVSVCI